MPDSSIEFGNSKVIVENDKTKFIRSNVVEMTIEPNSIWMKKDLFVDYLHVGGNIRSTERYLNIYGNVNIPATLRVGDNVIIEGNTYIKKDISVSGIVYTKVIRPFPPKHQPTQSLRQQILPIFVDGEVIITKNLHANKDVDIKKNLYVDGDIVSNDYIVSYEGIRSYDGIIAHETISASKKLYAGDIIHSFGEISASGDIKSYDRIISVDDMYALKYLHVEKDINCKGTVYGSTKLFKIPHPDPRKKNWILRHSAVETPTGGDTLYRYEIIIDKTLKGVIKLPSYFKYLNTNPQVWINAVNHFGKAYGIINDNLLKIYTDSPGKYNVLIIGTRKDKDAKLFDKLGAEYKEELKHKEKFKKQFDERKHKEKFKKQFDERKFKKRILKK